MQYYRCYLLDSAKSTQAIETIEALTDADAMAKARERLDTQVACWFAEVWSDGRMVGEVARPGSSWTKPVNPISDRWYSIGRPLGKSTLAKIKRETERNTASTPQIEAVPLEHLRFGRPASEYRIGDIVHWILGGSTGEGVFIGIPNGNPSTLILATAKNAGVESEMLECETQAEAAVIARLILQDRRDCQSIEVWEGTRCIEKASRSSLR
jgi:hypothetical protein